MKHALIFCASVLIAKCVPEESLRQRAPKTDQTPQAVQLAPQQAPDTVLPSPSPTPTTSEQTAYESLQRENERLHDQLKDLRIEQGTKCPEYESSAQAYSSGETTENW